MDDLVLLADDLGDVVLLAALVVCRVGAIALVLPPMVEGSLPVRVRLAVGLVLSFVVYPLVAPPETGLAGTAFTTVLLAECLTGLAIGLLIRVAVTALQVCGTIIAQATSLAQIMATPGMEPSPAIGQVLIFAGTALAMIFDLHIRLAISLAATYDLVPLGGLARPSALAEQMVARVAQLFALAFALAAPFTIAAFLYNLALGIANRAMPQLMVVLVGAPAIVGATLALLAVAAPHMLDLWMQTFGRIIDDPLGAI